MNIFKNEFLKIPLILRSPLTDLKYHSCWRSDDPFSYLIFCNWRQPATLNLTLSTKAHTLSPAAKESERICACPYEKETKGNVQTLTTIASLSTTSNNFNSLFRVFFIFPSRYLWAISLPLAYLALGGIYLPKNKINLGLQYRATRLDEPVLSKIKKILNFWLLIFLCCQLKIW